jgi:hypothetical protein
MRITKKLAVFSLASLITFGLGLAVQRLGSAAVRYFSEPSAWQVLLSFENQDLEGLDEQSTRVVHHAIEMATGQLDPTQHLPFEPRLFRKVSNSTGEPRYILVEELPMSEIPGAATIRVHIFDTAGKVLSSTEFDTGNRLSIQSIQIRKRDYWLNSEVLVISLEYCFGGSPSHQFYTVVGNELRLVYLGDGFLVESNNYQDPRLTIGPRLTLSADEWEADLQSHDDARVLSALVWLRGGHWNGEEAPYDKDRSDAEKVTDLRGRESVRRRLADLTNSTNYFVQHTAEAITKDR